VNGNGNNRRSVANCYLWRYWAGIVLLIAIGVFAATRGGTKIDPSKLAKVEKGDLAKSVWHGEGDAHHQGGSEVEGQRIVKKLLVDYGDNVKKGSCWHSSTRWRLRRRWRSRVPHWMRLTRT